MEEQDEVTINLGAMTLGEYLARHGDPVPADDVPSFISPGWLKRLDDKGLVTRRVTEDEQENYRL